MKSTGALQLASTRSHYLQTFILCLFKKHFMKRVELLAVTGIGVCLRVKAALSRELCPT